MFFGYFGGGYFLLLKSTVDRIDYSNDTATATAKGPLSQVRYSGTGATGNSKFWIFCWWCSCTIISRSY